MRTFQLLVLHQCWVTLLLHIIFSVTTACQQYRRDWNPKAQNILAQHHNIRVVSVFIRHLISPESCLSLMLV